ncbi:Short-chain dehydrogenase/reductase SDR [Bacillus thermotolerans]|nr:Short-chain dehydrogenase/reductase SDR [Bacillus thermotolerans]
MTVRMAAARGAKVVAAARNEEALKELVQELKGKGQSAVYVKADVGREDEVNRIAETAIQTFGRLDTWVNNAGSFIFGQAMEVGSEDAHLLFTTNFWGVVHGTKAAVQHFKERGMPGAVINVVSILGDKGTILQSAYATAKFAVHGWTESIRMELEKEKAPVSITLIRPSRVDTPWNEHGRSYLKKQPAHRGRVYPPEAVAEAILYSAEHPKRDIFAGSQSRSVQLIGSLFPRLMDKWMNGADDVCDPAG